MLSERGKVTFKQIAELVDEEWVAQETLALCRIKSVTMEEQEICRYYASRLRSLGLEAFEREVTPGRSNIYARLAGAGGGPTLAMNGHIDTVPIYEAWPPSRAGDRIFGRGATDMKGGMAALLATADAFIRSGTKLKGDLLLTAVVGHEEAVAKKDGPKAMVSDLKTGLISADAILIAEGASELWIMSMGAANFTIELVSKTGGTHTDNTPFRRNPIRFVAQIIEEIAARQEAFDRAEAHPLASHQRIDLGIVSAGDLYNRTPRRCTLVGTRRWLPGLSVADIRKELTDLVAPIAAKGDLGFSITIEQDREPFETDEDEAAVLATREAAELVTGSRPRFVGRRIVGDANIYVSGTGIPSYYYGPMNDTAHSDHEWVSVSSVADCARVYIGTSIGYCQLA